MHSLRDELETVFRDAFRSAGHDAKYARVAPSNRPDLSQFQCNGAFELAKSLKRPPREIATQVLSSLENHPSFASLSIDGPGFINMVVKDETLVDYLSRLSELKKPGRPGGYTPRKTIIDFCSPNVTKPMHVGHLRSTIIGDCLQRLLRYLGDEVTTDNHLGDWGTQMGMLIEEVKKEYEQKYPSLSSQREQYEKYGMKDYFHELLAKLRGHLHLSDLKRLYPEAVKRCQEDSSALKAAKQATKALQDGEPFHFGIWEYFVSLSKEAMEKDLARLGVRFDIWKGESAYQKGVEALIEKLEKTGQAEMSKGALILPLEDTGGDIPPLLLRKSDGAALYGTTDLAALVDRVKEDKARRILYVVDRRQELHFRQVFQAGRQMGILDGVEIKHIGFGTVNGPDGKPYKTREGGVMELGDLIDLVVKKARERMEEGGVAEEYSQNERKDIAQKVGIATLKFADLMNNRLSDYIFDVEKFSRFEGKTGPYLLYTAVRIRSILSKAEERGEKKGNILPPETPQERELMLALPRLHDAFVAAKETYSPHHLCDYVFAIAQCVNGFYGVSRILDEPDHSRRRSWLSLIDMSLRQMELCLDILGIEIPSRM